MPQSFITIRVCLIHCLAGKSRIMRSTFQPFSTRKTLINALSSEVSTGMFSYADDVNYDVTLQRIFNTPLKKIVACYFLL